jgi:hypothetical protein
VQEKIMANMANGGAAQQAAIAIAMKAAGKTPKDQMAEGGTNNPGFKALPPYVQAQILSNMGYGGNVDMFANGGYTVTRSDDRKGKTHKVTGPDGTVKYFGDAKLGQHPRDPERKAAFYARHKKNLDGNPYFRAFARATWADGGELDQYQKAGETKGLLEKWIDSHNAEAAKNGPGWFDRSVMAVTEDLPKAISNTFSRKNILKAVDEGAAKVIRGARNLGIGVPEFVTEDIFNKIRPVSYPTDLSQAVAEYTRSDKAAPTRDLQGDLAMDEEAWSMNLGRNTKQKYIVPSQYKPSMSSDPNAKYHTFAPGIIDPQAVAKLVSDEAYWNKNKKVNKKGVEYLPMRTMEPIVSKQFMVDYNKYKQMPFDQTDPMANFQIYRGVDPKTKKKYASISDVYDFGLESANAATNPINFYDRIYYREGGENDREMVEGIANILAMVNDDQNRAMIGQQMLRDFEDEDVDYNYDQFLKMAKLSKGKLPKAQVGLNLTPNQQSGYNWQNPFDQADMNPFMPKQIIKKADGTTETRGTVGPGTMLFEQNTVGTPTAAYPIVPITKKPKQDFFTGAYNRMMDQYTNPGSFMNILNVAGAAVNLATQGKRDRDFNSFLRERNASYNQIGNEAIDRGNYSVNPSSYGLLQPQNMGVDSPEGQYNGGRFFSMQDGGSMDIAAKYTVPSIDAILDSNMMSGFDFAPRTAAPDATFVNKPVAARAVQASSNLADLPLDADAMLATIGKQESSSKPGQNAVGLRTKLRGAGGKRGTASGTFQITDSTLRGIYNQHFDDQFNSFSQFKSAFDTNPQVEYSAAKALMNDHIKKYGIYALGAWYQPSFAARAAKGDMSVMNTIPAPEYGNRVTFGDYFNKSVKNYQKALGTMEQGGEYELTEAEIQQIRAMGGDVEFI